MSDPDASNAVNSRDQPGKTRTWWHPLLARLLDHVLATAYTVLDEVSVGKLPLRVDILLIRREAGNLSEAGARDLGVLLPLLNRFTLIEFKGPTDALEEGDLSQLLGCAYLWRSQQVELTPQNDISLIVLAPAVNAAVRKELKSLNGEMDEHEEGVFRLAGLPCTIWLVETDVMAERGDAVLSLVSRPFLKDRERIIELLTGTGHVALLFYMLQQVRQFRSLGEDFAMQHKDSRYLGKVEQDLLATMLGEVEEELLTSALERLPVEKRLRGLSPQDQEKLLTTIPAEKRLRGLSPEQLAAGLSEEQAARLMDLLRRKESN